MPDALEPKRTRSFASLRTVVALMLREMVTRYGKSPGGYVWAVLEPLGAILILGIGFSLVLRTPSLGNNFILFYATGYLAFAIYATVAKLVAKSLKFSKPLLFYPSVTWIDAVLARYILNTLVGLVVSYLLMTGILLATDTRAILDIPPIVVALMLASLVGLAIGTLNCAIIGILPAWEQIWSIATRPLFIASGVIFIYEDLPPLAQSIIWYNPLMHLTGYFRAGVYPTYNPNYISLSYVVVFMLVVLTFGLLMLRRYHKDIVNA